MEILNRLMYNKDILLVTSTEDDLELYLKRPMFRCISNIDNLYIENIDYISDIDLDYVLLSPYKDFYITQIEYRILNILYKNNDTYNRYSLYQYIYNHPLLQIPNIDEYIEYRDKLDNLCELDMEFSSIISGTI